ncbi:MAG: hypothetical protein V7767_14975, partial [Leeuwenhoekiella sp.]
ILVLCPGATETNFFEAAQMGTDKKNVIGANNAQSPEEVVKIALKGIKNGKIRVICGLQNRVLATAGNFIPHSIIVKALAKRFRINF